MSVSNVIYHKFSHYPTSYTLNGKNINIMLELFIIQDFSLQTCLKPRAMSYPGPSHKMNLGLQNNITWL